MQRSTQKNGLINLLILLAVGIATFTVSRLTGSVAGLVSSVFLGLGFLTAALSWFQMRLEEREQFEKLEFDELSKAKGASTLFASKEGEVFPAQQSREQFERFFVPAFTTLLLLAEIAGAYFISRWLGQPSAAIEPKQPIVPMFFFAVFFLVLFLFGRFSATLTRLENHRLLRPGAGWMLLDAFICAAVAVGLLGVWSGFLKADLYVARILCAVLGLVAVETLANLLLELYRPRVKGKVKRPLYESRFVGLLGQPEGLVTTAAQALDYQFGFKVSETWFFRLLVNASQRLLLFFLLALFLSSCLVFIEPGEQGLLERFGRPIPGMTLLAPGGHLKYPWPIDHVYRYRTEQIQSFNVGFVPDPALENQTTVLWTVSHTKEEVNFLVANRDATSAAALERGTNSASSRRAPPVSLLTVSIPIQFQIHDLLAWVYNNDDSSNLLQSIATREIVRFLVNADFNEIMSRDRAASADALRERIQAAADERKLGARIVFVGLQDIHPPQKVAADYENVIGAYQIKQAKILAAQAEDIRTNALAGARAADIVNKAVADRVARVVGARARTAVFTNQIPAFAAAPSVFAMRSYLQVFARATADARKYVVLTTNTHDVIQFDLAEKFTQEMTDLSVSTKNSRP
jgi:membrane protease subunit HflK